MASGVMLDDRYTLERRDSIETTSSVSTINDGVDRERRKFMLNESSTLLDTSNLLQTSFNYINSIIGSGVLAMAYAMKEAGFGMGIILLVLSSLVSDYSLCILVKAGLITGSISYQELMHSAFGLPGFYLLTVMQFIYPFVAMVSYNIIIGDTITKVLRRFFQLSAHNIFTNRHFVVALCNIFIMLPLSLQRNITRLNKASLLSLFCVMGILAFLIAKTTQFVHEIPRVDGAYDFAKPGILKAIGVITFAFMCHHNSFLLFAAMENASEKRWNRATHIAVAVAFVVTLAFGVTGYVAFNEFSQGDLLENFCLWDDGANVARLVFSVTMILTFPIEAFVTREVIEGAFLIPSLGVPSVSRHAVVTILLAVAAFGFSTLTDCLGVVIQLNGILTAIPLAYILPALILIKVDPSHLLSRVKIPALLLALVGVVCAVGGVALIVHDWLTEGAGIASCSHGRELPYCSRDFNINNVTSLLMREEVGVKKHRIPSL